MNKRLLISAISFLLLLTNNLISQIPDPIREWNFNDLKVDQSKPFSIIDNDSRNKHSGKFYITEGIEGSALLFDGYTTWISNDSTSSLKLKDSFTIEAWIAIGAYPWNWAPIVAQENTESMNSNLDASCWPEDIKETGLKNGFYFGVGPRGELGLFLSVNYDFKLCKTNEQIPLFKWTHVAAVYDPKKGISIYINGNLSQELEIEGKPTFATGSELLIGRNHEKREPAFPVRTFATLATWYTFDGIIDEIKMYDESLESKMIKNRFNEFASSKEPKLAKRILPSGPEGPGKFGAAYHTLKYYDGWDNLWPVGPDADIVVRFDNSPIKVVFWRGTRYSPVWVMENNLMMADQSIENFDYVDGCFEHMLDPRCRFSHVRIIENTDARVVVHWRYCPVTASGQHSQVDETTGWEDWVDEYFTFFPDGIAVRKVVQHSIGRSLWPEEVIALCHPGQTPEDVIELDAMTLVNHQGIDLTLSWAGKTAQLNDTRFKDAFGENEKDKPVIMMSNLKSKFKPFKIYEEGSSVRIFAHEQRKDVSNFPWWNHWPVAMIPSDGRYCQAADRASHFSLAWGGVVPNKGDGDNYWWAIMYGATDEAAVSLVQTERSWNNPPAVLMNEKSYLYKGYDKTQRCYNFENLNINNPTSLNFDIIANELSPVENLSIVIENWGDKKFSVYLDGISMKNDNKLRTGYINKTDTKDLILWIEKESIDNVGIKVVPN